MSLPLEGPADFDHQRPHLLQAARDYLDHYQKIIRELHQAGAGGRRVVADTTHMFDVLITTLFEAVAADLNQGRFGKCTLIALGGYGRLELNPRSDIDIMFYYSGRDRAYAEKVSERMLYLLWDLGLDVGYSVRTQQDCLDIVEKDVTARTALLDSRYLAGDATLYEGYRKEVLTVVFGRNSQAFIRAKIEENDKRLQKYGSSVYLLEPNIKEGEGGLRDLHSALWVAQVKYKAHNLKDLVIRGVISERERQEFEDALDYLWRIRNELHYLTTRKSDQMQFNHQEKIAEFLGYQNSRKGLAVEQFMQDYYYHATRVEHLSSSLIARITQQEKPSTHALGYLTRRQIEAGFYILRGELRVSGPEIFRRDPPMIMRAFFLAQRHQAPLSLELKGLIRDNLGLINDKVRRDRTMNEMFFEILRSPRDVGKTLRVMHHLQFLNRYIPEFGRIFCKVQHDLYHTYTVDTHSIFAVEEVLKLRAGLYRDKHPVLTGLAGDIEKPELLLLAVLFHDIGKGEGKDHSNKGADMMPTIARRFGLNREDSRRLEFLVRHHLDMTHISQRRDLHDEDLILQFARSMGMSENLKMLYLLTFADLKAVGPDVWNDWKGMLLQELYEKTYQVLEKGDFELEKRSEKLRKRKRNVLEALTEEFDPRMVREQLRALSPRYLMSYRSAEIVEHLRLSLGRGKRTLALHVEHETRRGFSEVTISTLDIPGLFSKITGVMAANGINILGAQIHTRSNGEALDILQVASSGGSIENPQKWQRVEEELTAVFEGRAQVGELVAKRRPPAFMTERPRPRFPNRVDVSNEISAQYTVIDVFAHDKVGLLYTITKTLKDLGLYIGVAKISTKVDQAADVFYVQDIFCQKIVQEEKIAEIKQRLLTCLDDG
ncbi:uridylyltransferase [Geoalkalibacter ferrihydriticus DSM 17813]|uniref:Bifunctional uridylyltransferase/uridylyl-removing enzyme n=1 Tax=Geoalkalibacter ferrihydriticus DSM 17813 TaxID=1121915 RepID=A0A0C2HQM3_9BACT|nr:uridylyltransferase [Geoalkalibacter ferrihydriticus DSM 17813]